MHMMAYAESKNCWVVVLDIVVSNLYLGMIEPTDTYVSSELKPPSRLVSSMSHFNTIQHPKT